MMLSRFALSCWWISVQCKCSSTIVSVLCCVSALTFETEKSFPSNFWGHEGIARIDVSMMRNNNKNKEVSIFSPSALHTNFSYLMRLISCLLGPYLWVVGFFFLVCLFFFEFWCWCLNSVKLRREHTVSVEEERKEKQIERQRLEIHWQGKSALKISLSRGKIECVF